MMSAIVFGLIAAGVALAALLLVQRAADFTRRNGPVAAAFAGGLVITIAVTHLIPEALAMTANAAWLVLAGFGFGFVVHSLLGAGAHDHAHVGAHDHDHGQAPKPISPVTALAPVIAIALHSALDGLIYSVTFAVDVETAIIAATGLIIHEFPEALICFVLLQRAGLSNLKASILAFLASGATTFGAAAVSAPFANLLDADTLGILFALVAGLLLHVGAAHLIHEAGEAGALRGGGAVFAGAGVAALMAVAHGHSHDHGGHDHGGHVHGDHAHDEAAHGDHAHDDHDHEGHEHGDSHGHETGLDAAEIHDHSDHEHDHGSQTADPTSGQDGQDHDHGHDDHADEGDEPHGDEDHDHP